MKWKVSADWLDTNIFSFIILPCQDQHKNHNVMDLEIVVENREASSLKISKGQLGSLNMTLTFACFKFGIMV